MYVMYVRGSKRKPRTVLLTEQHTFFTCVILSRMTIGGHGGDVLLNKVIILVFSVHRKYSRSFVKLRYHSHNYELETRFSLSASGRVTEHI